MPENSRELCGLKAANLSQHLRGRVQVGAVARRRLATFVAVTLATALGANRTLGLAGQPTSVRQPALTEDQVQQALNVLSPRRVSELIQARGTTFILGPDGERRLREIAAAQQIDRSLLDEIINFLAPPKNASPGQEWSAPTDRRSVIWVPAGRFQMGSPEGESGRDADEALHAVPMANGFWMDASEVTYAAYQRFVLVNPAWQKDRIDPKVHDGTYLADWTGNNFPAAKADDPVVNVSWYAAQAYARWAGKRLPTEAEWEYACRAGTATIYWWGAEFDAGASALTRPPSAARRNPWGLIHSLGGVWEWTSSLYRDYPYRSDDGRDDPAAQGPRVMRGGSAANDRRMLRSANRNRDAPERCSDLLGFRCVL